MSDGAPEVEQPIELQGVYCNGFQIGLTNGDVSGLMLLNGQPQIVLNMSYTVAKSLSVALAGIISKLEEVTGRPIMTTKEIDAGMSKLMSEGETKQ